MPPAASAARRAWARPTSISSRARSSPAELMADVGHGLYVTEMIGQGVNPVTGDYSRGASGFIIENGELAGAGRRDHHRRQPARHVPRARPPPNDLEFRRAVNVPTLRVEGMTVAGA